MYLTLGYVSFFKIHLGYIHDTFQDTMYLNPQIHDTQDTLTIHVGYIGIHSRIRISSPTCTILRPGCISSLDEFEIHVSDHHVSRMYPACILITLADTCILLVSRMYPASQIRTSQDTFEIHVSQYVSWKYPACIPYVSSNLCRYMCPACIPHVSRMYLACILHVSHVRSSLQVCLPCNSYRGAQRR